VRTWLVVAAEALEFSGILKRCGPVQRLDQPGARFAGVQFAREASWKGDRWWLIAHGPGARLVRDAMKPVRDAMKPVREAMKDVLRERLDVAGIISTGFCGALDPALSVGAIVVSGELRVRCPAPFVQGGIVSLDRVAVSAEEKRALRQATGCSAVDMEYSEVRKIAGEWGVPVAAIRVVSDTAADTLPLDFNAHRDAQGRFSRGRVALAAVGRPFTAIPGLLRLSKHCNLAAEKLGEFFADCEL
jgi:hypothetical protein